MYIYNFLLVLFLWRTLTNTGHRGRTEHQNRIRVTYYTASTCTVKLKLREEGLWLMGRLTTNGPTTAMFNLFHLTAHID